MSRSTSMLLRSRLDHTIFADWVHNSLMQARDWHTHNTHPCIRILAWAWQLHSAPPSIALISFFISKVDDHSIYTKMEIAGLAAGLLFFTVFLLKQDFAKAEIIGAVVLPHGKQKMLKLIWGLSVEDRTLHILIANFVIKYCFALP